MKLFQHNISHRAIVLMISAMFCFAAMSGLVRHLSLELPVAQLVFLRNCFSLLIMGLAMLAAKKNRRSKKISQHFQRSILGLVAMYLWFYTLSLIPLSFATAISFMTPIFTIIMATIFLGETIGIRRISSILVSFLGVLIILQPMNNNVGEINYFGGFIALAASAMISVTIIIVKSLTKHESALVIVFYMSFFMTILSAPAGLYFWKEVSFIQMLLVFITASFSTVAHFLVAKALTLADVVALMPFEFTRMIFAIIIATLLLNEKLEWTTITGGLIIIASAFYANKRSQEVKLEESKLKKIKT